MKLKIIHLIFLLYCFFFSASDLRSSQSNAGTRLTESIVVENHGTRKAVAIKDTIREQDASHFIEGFYRAYTVSFLSAAYKKEHAIQDNGFRMENYLTKRVIEKMGRVVLSTGVDAVIRAQDFNETGYETLLVKPLEDNWYMVSYQWETNGEDASTRIPLKVILVDGQYKIDYITPEWNDSLYGAFLLCDNAEQQPVDNTSPLSFVKTFYAVYLSEYARMPENLIFRLATLRKNHFTPNALAQFESASNESKSDGRANYDLVIDNFDFDCLWIPSVTYTQLSEGTFQIRSKQSELVMTIVVTLVNYHGGYKIDNISAEKQEVIK